MKLNITFFSFFFLIGLAQGQAGLKQSHNAIADDTPCIPKLFNKKALFMDEAKFNQQPHHCKRSADFTSGQIPKNLVGKTIESNPYIGKIGLNNMPGPQQLKMKDAAVDHN